MVRIISVTPDDRPVNSALLSFDGFRLGVRRLALMSVFVVPFGLAFGAAAVAAGLSVSQAVMMSALVFAGASQFAVLELWVEPLPFVTLAVTVLAINARHILLGAALSPWVNQLPVRQRLWSLALLSDANFADSHQAFKSGLSDVGIMVGGGFIIWAAWVLGTTVGALVGSGMGDLGRFGFDVLMASFFVAVAAGQINEKSDVMVGIVAAVVAVATLGPLAQGWNIIAAAIAGGVVGGLNAARQS